MGSARGLALGISILAGLFLQGRPLRGGQGLLGGSLARPACARVSLLGRLCLRGGGCGGGGCGTCSGGGCGMLGGDEEGEEAGQALLDATSSDEGPDLEEGAKRVTAIAKRKETWDLQEQQSREDALIRKRAGMGVIEEDLDTLVLWFIRRYLSLWHTFWYRPIFDFLDLGDDGFLSADVIESTVRAGLVLFDEDVVELRVQELPDGEEFDDEEVEILVAEYMELDEDGDGVLSFDEFSRRFTRKHEAELSATLKADLREDFDQDALGLEDSLINQLDAMEKRVEGEVRQVLAVMNERLDKHRTPLERGFALVKARGPCNLTLFELSNVVRPVDMLTRTTPLGTNISRTAEEAKVAEMERDAMRHGLSDERYEAVRLLTLALTGQEVPPPEFLPPDDVIDEDGPWDWDWVQRTNLPHSFEGYVGNYSVVFRASLLVNRAQIYRTACTSASVCAPNKIEDCNGVVEEADQPTDLMAVLMEYAMSDLEEAKKYAYEGMRDETRQWVLQHARDVLASACWQQGVCYEIMCQDDKAIACWEIAQDLGEHRGYIALREASDTRVPLSSVWRANFSPARHSYPRSYPGIPTAGPDNATEYVIAPGRTPGIADVLDNVRPNERVRVEAGMHEICEEGERVTVPPPFKWCGVGWEDWEGWKDWDWTKRARVARVEGEDIGELKLKEWATHQRAQDETVLKGDMANWERYCEWALQEHIEEDEPKFGGMVSTRRRRIPSRKKTTVGTSTAALLSDPPRYQPPRVLKDEDGLQHVVGVERAPPPPKRKTGPLRVLPGRSAGTMLDEECVRTEKGLRALPSDSFSRYMNDRWGNFSLSGPPNAWCWGRWNLAKNSSGSFTGLTCAIKYGLDKPKREMAFTFWVFGGPWQFESMDARVCGTGGVVCAFDDSETSFAWCGLGGLDMEAMRAVEILNIQGDSRVQLFASVLEFSGEQNGNAIRVDNDVEVNITSCVMQHAYNQLLITHRPTVRLTNSTLWNHTDSAFWAFEWAEQGAELLMYNNSIHGVVWRNDIRPWGVRGEETNVRHAKNTVPNEPAPQPKRRRPIP